MGPCKKLGCAPGNPSPFPSGAIRSVADGVQIEAVAGRFRLKQELKETTVDSTAGVGMSPHKGWLTHSQNGVAPLSCPFRFLRFLLFK